MKCSESRAIAQAQEEGHGGGYVAMTLTFKMATTGKWTVSPRKLQRLSYLSGITNRTLAKINTIRTLKWNCPLAHCTTPGTMILVLTQSVCGVWAPLGACVCVCAASDYWCLSPPFSPGIDCGGVGCRGVGCGGWGVDCGGWGVDCGGWGVGCGGWGVGCGGWGVDCGGWGIDCGGWGVGCGGWGVDCGGWGVGCGGVVPSVSAKNKPQLIHLQHIQQTQQSAVTANSPGLTRLLSQKLVCLGERKLSSIHSLILLKNQSNI